MSQSVLKPQFQDSMIQTSQNIPKNKRSEAEVQKLVELLNTFPIQQGLNILYGYFTDDSPLILDIENEKIFDILWNSFVGYIPNISQTLVSEPTFTKIVKSWNINEIYSISLDMLPWRLRSIDTFTEDPNSMLMGPTSGRDGALQDSSILLDHNKSFSDGVTGLGGLNSSFQGTTGSNIGANIFIGRGANQQVDGTISVNAFQCWISLFSHFPLSVSRITFSIGSSRQSQSTTFSLNRFQNRVWKRNPYLEMLRRYLEGFWKSNSEIFKRDEVLNSFIAYWLENITIHRASPIDQFNNLSNTRSLSTPEEIYINPNFIQTSWNVIKCVKVLVQFFLSEPRLKTGVISVNQNRSNPLFSSMTQELIRLQTPLFHFFHNCFTYLPQVSSKIFPFYNLIDLLISYIAPWKHHSDTKPSDWLPFIRSNWCFYAVLLNDILQCLNRFNEEQTSSFWKNFNSLLSIFLEKDIQNLIRQVDNYFIDITNQSFTNFTKSFPDIAENIINLCGDFRNYKPLFQKNQEQIITLIKHHIHVSNKWALFVHEQSKKSFLEENFSFLFAKKNTHEKEEQEMKIHEKIVLNLEALFHTGIDAKKLLFSKKEIVNITQSQDSKILKEPSTNENGELTDEGRMQLAHGLRKCSKKDGHFIGDTLFVPVNSNEIPALTYFAIKISLWLNYHLGHNKESKSKINLRFLSDYRVLIFLLVLGVIVSFIIIIIFYLIFILRYK